MRVILSEYETAFVFVACIAVAAAIAVLAAWRADR
jgi:hypothetical protein